MTTQTTLIVTTIYNLIRTHYEKIGPLDIPLEKPALVPYHRPIVFVSGLVRFKCTGGVPWGLDCDESLWKVTRSSPTWLPSLPECYIAVKNRWLLNVLREKLRVAKVAPPSCDNFRLPLEDNDNIELLLDGKEKDIIWMYSAPAFDKIIIVDPKNNHEIPCILRYEPSFWKDGWIGHVWIRMVGWENTTGEIARQNRLAHNSWKNSGCNHVRNCQYCCSCCVKKMKPDHDGSSPYSFDAIKAIENSFQQEIRDAKARRDPYREAYEDACAARRDAARGTLADWSFNPYR